MDENRNKTAARPVVTVREGSLRGRSRTTPGGTPYHSFLGIPYAKPPVGQLRFQAPQPPDSWTGVRDASKEGPICMQPQVKIMLQPRTWRVKDVSAFVAAMPAMARRVTKAFKQSEDCLYLNVYTPELPREQNQPNRAVLFWIHGGGFLVGDGHGDIFGPEYFIDHGVVVISINYRLGPFGFLALGSEAASGNAGLKDQVQALRWVRANVGVFGGDPNRVTVYGESAGAASAHLLTLSPLSNGLIHGAIAGSGTGMHPWALSDKIIERSQQLAKLLGIKSDDPKQIVADLQRVSAEKLVQYTTKLNVEDRYVGNELWFQPVIEPDYPGAFLSESPATILKEGKQAPIPFMTGANDREGLLWFVGNPSSGPRTELETEMMKLSMRTDHFIPDDLYEVLTAEERPLVSKEIIDYYFGEKGICKATLENFIDLFGDALFINDLHICARAHRGPNTPVYVYYFAFDGRLAFFKRLLRLHKYNGCAHSDELAYLFRCKVLPDVKLTQNSPELKCRNQMMKLWTNFIKTGNPTPPKIAEELNVIWEPVGEKGMQYLKIGSDLEMRQDILGERVEFWDRLYRKYTNKPVLS